MLNLFNHWSAYLCEFLLLKPPVDQSETRVKLIYYCLEQQLKVAVSLENRKHKQHLSF